MFFLIFFDFFFIFNFFCFFFSFGVFWVLEFLSYGVFEFWSF